MLPLFVFSQNRIEDNEQYAQITLKDGYIIECVIQDENELSITYYSWLEGGVKTISRDLIKEIKRKKDLHKMKQSKEIHDINANNKIHPNTTLLPKVAPLTKTPIQSKVPFDSKSAGDYLIQAGNNYLLGVGLGIGGGVATIVGSSNSEEALVYIGAGMALTGFVCTIIGHTELIKAGKALKENRSLSLHPSTSGLGLALRF